MIAHAQHENVISSHNQIIDHCGAMNSARQHHNDAMAKIAEYKRALRVYAGRANKTNDKITRAKKEINDLKADKMQPKIELACRLSNEQRHQAWLWQFAPASFLHCAGCNLYCPDMFWWSRHMRRHGRQVLKTVSMHTRPFEGDRVLVGMSSSVRPLVIVPKSSRVNVAAFDKTVDESVAYWQGLLTWCSRGRWNASATHPSERSADPFLSPAAHACQSRP